MAKPNFKSTEQKARERLIEQHVVIWAEPLFKGGFGKVVAAVYHGIEKLNVSNEDMNTYTNKMSRILWHEKLAPEVKKQRVDALTEEFCRTRLGGDEKLAVIIKAYWTQLNEFELFAQCVAVDFGPQKTPENHFKVLYVRQHLISQLALYGGAFTAPLLVEAFEDNIREAFGNALPSLGRAGSTSH